MGKYQKTSLRKKENKIISMPLDANFFFERAIYHLDKNDFSKALKYFWRIVDVEPDNPVHYCNLAGLLSEMGRFKESNELLLYVVEKLDSNLTECYYYLANNYAYLEELELSFKYIHRYLDAEPTGEFADEANEMLSYISTEIDDYNYNTDEEERKLFLSHYKAKNLLEEGKYYEAIKRLKQMVENNPDFFAARNNLALAYFYKGNYLKAIEQSGIVLENDDTNIHALCNLAIFYQHVNQEDELRFLLNLLKKIHPFHRKHLYKLATTFALLAEHELAFKNLIKIVSNNEGINPTIFHYLAVAAYNTERYELAKRYWLKIKKLDMEKQVSTFYLDITERFKEESDFKLPVLCYQYELPFEQLINLIQEKPGKYKNNFTLNAFIWALKNGEDKLKEQIILGLAMFKSREAEQILRDFLLDDDNSYYLKKKVLLALEEINAIPPYDTVFNGKLYHLERQTPIFGLWKKNWLEVLDMIEDKIGKKYNVIEVFDAKTLWFDFINKTYPHTPIIRKIEGWVAALEYIVAKMHQKSVSIDKLSNRYKVSRQTVVKNINQLKEILKINNNIKNLPFSRKD